MNQKPYSRIPCPVCMNDKCEIVDWYIRDTYDEIVFCCVCRNGHKFDFECKYHGCDDVIEDSIRIVLR